MGKQLACCAASCSPSAAATLAWAHTCSSTCSLPAHHEQEAQTHHQQQQQQLQEEEAQQPQRSLHGPGPCQHTGASHPRFSHPALRQVLAQAASCTRQRPGCRLRFRAQARAGTLWTSCCG
jgi:hypothetical protein